MNSVSQHIHDTAPGVIGTSVAGGFTLAGFFASTIPALQVISLLTGIAVGIVTFIYYLRKVRGS